MSSRRRRRRRGPRRPFVRARFTLSFLRPRRRRLERDGDSRRLFSFDVEQGQQAVEVGFVQAAGGLVEQVVGDVVGGLFPLLVVDEGLQIGIGLAGIKGACDGGLFQDVPRVMRWKGV